MAVALESATITVDVGGPLFSTLFFDKERCLGDQEGFLLGSISTRFVDSMNDSQTNARTQETMIDIIETLDCDAAFSFYNGQGDIDKAKLKTVLGTKGQYVIGWYRFRRGTNVEPLFLENVLHRNLLALLKNNKDAFLFSIFTSHCNHNLATHSFDYVFLRLNQRSKFEPVSLTITNLGDSSQGHYKPCMSLTSQQQFLDTTGHSSVGNVIKKVRSSIEKNLKVVCQQVMESENLYNKMKREVDILQTQIRIRQARLESPDGVGTIARSLSCNLVTQAEDNFD